MANILEGLTVKNEEAFIERQAMVRTVYKDAEGELVGHCIASCREQEDS